MGWPGGWSDPDPGGSGDRSIPLAAALGNQLYLNELDDALAQIRQETGLDKFELIGMDACLMGHVEVLSALAPHANYAVLSQETEPALGWAYTSFLGALNDNPTMNGDGLATAIVDSYIEGDQRIVDPQAVSYTHLDVYKRQTARGHPTNTAQTTAAQTRVSGRAIGISSALR